MRINLGDLGRELKDAELAEREHFPELERCLRTGRPDSAVYLDLGGVEFVGFAYACSTVVRCVAGVLRGEYPTRWLVLCAGERQDTAGLDGLAQALASHRQTLLLLQRPRVAAFGYLSREQPFEPRRVQRKRQKMGNLLTLLW